MPRFERITTYDGALEAVYGKNGCSERAAAWFAEKFPEGHATSIRPFAEMFLKELKRGWFEPTKKHTSTCYFHMRAVELLIRYGVDYTPADGQIEFFGTWEDKPAVGKCFDNSWLLMKERNARTDGNKLVYVEGMCWGFIGDPALHAWNSFGMQDTRAIDWTQFFACEWNRYLGIPFTQEEHAELCALIHKDETHRPISMFDIMFFPLVEERLTELLASREPPGT